MKFPNLIEYLTKSGVLDAGSAKEIAEAKKEYRKQYLLEKKQAYRRKNKTVSLSWPNSRMKQLEKEALEHNMKVSQYLKECIRVAREQAYILPNAEKIHQIEVLLRRVGSHTNQIARLANSMSMPPTRALAEMKNHLEYFEKTFDQMFVKPKNLKTYITEELERNPAFAHTLLRIIENHIRSLRLDN